MIPLFLRLDRWLLCRAPLLRGTGFHLIALWLLFFSGFSGFVIWRSVALDSLYFLPRSIPIIFIISTVTLLGWVSRRVRLAVAYVPARPWAGWYLTWVDLVCALGLFTPVLVTLAWYEKKTFSLITLQEVRSDMWKAEMLRLLTAGDFEGTGFEYLSDVPSPWPVYLRTLIHLDDPLPEQATRQLWNELQVSSPLSAEQRGAVESRIRNSKDGQSFFTELGLFVPELRTRTFALGSEPRFRAAFRRMMLPGRPDDDAKLTKHEARDLASILREISKKYAPYGFHMRENSSDGESGSWEGPPFSLKINNLALSSDESENKWDQLRPNFQGVLLHGTAPNIYCILNIYSNPLKFYKIYIFSDITLIIIILSPFVLAIRVMPLSSIPGMSVACLGVCVVLLSVASVASEFNLDTDNVKTGYLGAYAVIVFVFLISTFAHRGYGSIFRSSVPLVFLCLPLIGIPISQLFSKSIFPTPDMEIFRKFSETEWKLRQHIYQTHVTDFSFHRIWAGCVALLLPVAQWACNHLRVRPYR